MNIKEVQNILRRFVLFYTYILCIIAFIKVYKKKNIILNKIVALPLMTAFIKSAIFYIYYYLLSF